MERIKLKEENKEHLGRAIDEINKIPGAVYTFGMVEAGILPHDVHKFFKDVNEEGEPALKKYIIARNFADLINDVFYEGKKRINPLSLYHNIRQVEKRGRVGGDYVSHQIEGRGVNGKIEGKVVPKRFVGKVLSDALESAFGRETPQRTARELEVLMHRYNGEGLGDRNSLETKHDLLKAVVKGRISEMGEPFRNDRNFREELAKATGKRFSSEQEKFDEAQKYMQDIRKRLLKKFGEVEKKYFLV